MRNGSFVVAAIAAVLAGCSTPEYLRQPERIPMFVMSYENAALQRAKNVPCALNLINCVGEASLAKVKMSGRRVQESKFPMRDIVGAEFGALLKANFRPVVGSEQPRMEMKVETHRTILERDGDDVIFDLSLSVKLLNPRHTDKPYFSKTYSARTEAVRQDDVYVPICVYEAVQRVAADFIRDVAADESLVAHLAAL